MATHIRANYDETINKSLKMELHALQERISSLKAGLRTWQDHLNRIQALDDRYEQNIEQIRKVLQEIQTPLDEPVAGTEREMLEQFEATKVSVDIYSFSLWHFSLSLK